VVSFSPGPVVTMYSCGITPTTLLTWGHAAVYLFTSTCSSGVCRMLDTVARCVRNVTDIDDDILRKSREMGVHYLDLAAEEMARFDAEMGMLNLLPVYSRATGGRLPYLNSVVGGSCAGQGARIRVGAGASISM